MRTITLEHLEVWNFRSFHHARVDLRRDAGLHLLAGRNDTDPRLGANGAGKSSVWEAVAFCLFGKSSRGLRPNELIRHGQDSMRVAVQVRVDDHVLIVERGAPRGRLLLDGAEVAQDVVDAQLGRTYGSFLQTVLFGQGRPLFLDLSIPDRSALLDEVLDLNVWLTHADAAALEARSLTDEIARQAATIRHLEGALEEAVESRGTLATLAEEFEAGRKAQIDELLDSADEAEGQLQDAAAAEERAAAAAVAARPAGQQRAILEGAIEATGELRSALSGIDDEVQKLRRRVEFFERTDTCPTCEAPLTAAHVKQHTAELQEQIETAKARRTALIRMQEAKAGEVLQLQQEWREQQEQEKQTAAALREARAAKVLAERTLRDLERRLQQVSSAPNAAADRLAAAGPRIASMEVELEAARAHGRTLVGRREEAEFWKAGFKRLRTFLAARVLGVLEIEVANAASALGLEGWRLRFAGERETASQTVKSGIHVTIEAPDGRVSPFESWSGGEAQRIRLAVALGLAALIDRISGARYRVEVWDEPSNWLSLEGIEDLMNCLADRGRALGKAIWILDHRALMSSAFTSIATVAKTAEGSAFI